MESLKLSPLPSKLYNKTHSTKLTSLNTANSCNNNNNPTTLSTTLTSHQQRYGKSFKLFATMAPFVSDTEIETETPDGKFDWYAEWYPVMPVCDLDKNVVLWWDRNERGWKVFDDSCPHRLAPLSEGRIDQRGRLQCAYHSWCFNGGGDCKLIPQAPPDGPLDSAAEKRNALVFMCIPVSPGKSRLIWAFPRNFMTWTDKVIPRWMIHIGQNLILDSDLHLLHVEERKIMEAGGSAEWQEACFVPTKSDAFVVGFRKWLNKYAGGQVDWRGKFNTALPPTPHRELLMDRYWTHVVNCRSCSGAHKALKVVEVALQVVSISVLGIVAATKQAILTINGC